MDDNKDDDEEINPKLCFLFPEAGAGSGFKFPEPEPSQNKPAPKPWLKVIVLSGS